MLSEPRVTDGSAIHQRLLSGMNENQRAAVTSPASHLVILAGAGSGKTRVLTHRIARRVLDDDIDPRRVLALTFTRKAAGELRSRLARLGLPHPVHAGTFHAVAYAQLRQRWAERNITPPELLDRKVGFIARCMSHRGSSTLPLDVTAEIEWAKARMISATDYPTAATVHGRRPPIDADQIAEIYTRYETTKRERRMVDFDDLLRLATRDLRVDEHYAQGRRWMFRHLFVDEFQDVNPLQFELLRSWLGDSTVTDLCLVGDPNQAIYSWNGADASFLERASEYFPGSEIVELRDNYRSSPQILGFANTVLTSNIGPGAPSQRGVILRPNRGDGPLPDVTVFESEQAEARGLARRVRDRHGPGTAWSDQAILVRTNAQLAVLEEAFHAAGIPTRSRGSGRLLEQPEVKHALRSIRQGPGQLRERLDELERSLDTKDDTNDDPESELSEDRRANVAELVRLGHEFMGLDPNGGAGHFEAWLITTMRADDTTANRDAVDLSTFHAAKGLEWPIVYVAGLEEGLVPIHYAQTDSAQAEERRLLYVAFTRAERELHCSYATSRTFGSKTLPRRPSPYLEVLTLARELLASGHSPVDLTSAVETARQRLETGGKPAPTRTRRDQAATLSLADKGLFNALKHWRAAQARLIERPAFMILSDKTLTEIAATRPLTVSELTEVSGIGPIKAEHFGPAVLRIVAEHGDEPVTTPDHLSGQPERSASPTATRTSRVPAQ